MNERNDVIMDVRGLNTSFITNKKEIKIIKNVSFRVLRGHTLAVVGESGCGKSVTMHSIARLLPENARMTAEAIELSVEQNGELNTIRLDKLKAYGREMRSLRGTHIGMIFQDPMASLNPVYRVGNQIIENLRQHEKISRKEAIERAVNMLAKLGIPDPQTRILDYPHQLSGGMKQRVMIALAMICNPDILIADEPTTALDVTIQAQIMELMKKLQTEQGKTIVLITHNMGLVAEMADEVCVMYMGRVMEYGTVEDIFHTPAHPYTRRLLASVPVPGMPRDKELVTIPGSTPNPADLMDGCEFADRCEYCCEECRHGDMPVQDLGNNHKVRCLMFTDKAGDMG